MSDKGPVEGDAKGGACHCGSPPADARIRSPACLRNRDPILAVIERVLPHRGVVLEVASGSGEHAAWFAPRLAPLVWQPSDPDPICRRSIAAHVAEVACATLRAPLDLDAAMPDWPIEQAEAIVCINMLHIAPWRAAEGLFAGAARILPPGGVLYLYGPYKRDGAHTAASNAAFDAGLRRDNAAWGVRDLEAVADLGGGNGLALREVVAMPANNQSLVFERA